MKFYDIELFRTGYVPTHEECWETVTHIAEQKDLLRIVTYEIDHKKGNLNNLHQQARTLRWICKLAEAFIAPIRRIPSYILQDIMVLCISNMTEGENRWNCDIDDSRNTPQPYETILALERVCRYWRTLLISAPKIWTKMNIDVLDTFHMDLVERHFAFSGALPMDIDLNVNAWSDSTLGAMIQLAKLVDTHRDRIRRCVLGITVRPQSTVYEDAWLYTLKAIFPPNGLVVTWKILEILEIFDKYRPGINLTEPRFALGPIHAPKLRRLFLNRTVMYSYDLANLSNDACVCLRSLYINLGMGSQYHRLQFSRFVNLKELDIEEPVFLHRQTITSRISLPSLRRLRLAVRSPIWLLQGFYSSLDFPSLEELHVTNKLGQCDYSYSLDVVEYLFHNTPTYPVRALFFSRMCLNTDAFERVVQRLPHLMIIKLHNTKLSRGFSRLFRPSHPGHHVACPSLELLHLDQCFYPINELQQFIFTISESLSGDGRLTKVELFGGGAKDEEETLRQLNQKYSKCFSWQPNGAGYYFTPCTRFHPYIYTSPSEA